MIIDSVRAGVGAWLPELTSLRRDPCEHPVVRQMASQ